MRSPSSERLQANLDKTRGFYSDAYGWNATVNDIGEITATKSRRQYIKSWITALDLERLYDIRPAIETVDVAPDYEENKDIEQPAESNSDDADDE